MPFTTKTQLKIYYETRGEGERVLFISGTGADLRTKPNMLDSPLAAQNQVLAYDQRGLGQSEKPASEYTMAQYADDAADLLDALGWPSAHIVGVSFGGMVALNLALRHPEKIDKLILCCTSPGGPNMSSYPLHEIPTTLNDRDRIKFLMAINDTRLDASWQAENPEKVERIIDTSLEMRHPDQQSETFLSAGRKQLIARSHHDVIDRLGDITMPCLICAGRFDGLAPVENQQSLCDLLPNAQLSWFNGGHLFLIQDKTAWATINKFIAN